MAGSRNPAGVDARTARPLDAGFPGSGPTRLGKPARKAGTTVCASRGRIAQRTRPAHRSGNPRRSHGPGTFRVRAAQQVETVQALSDRGPTLPSLFRRATIGTGAPGLSVPCRPAVDPTGNSAQISNGD